MPRTGYKRCTKCGEEKGLGEFYVRRASKDGLSPICKACTKIRDQARQAANPEEARKRARDWYAENKPKALERERRKRLENLEEYRAKGRKYAQLEKDGAKRRMDKWLSDPANVERKRQKDKEWRERNKERKAANDKRWAQENREHRNAYVKRYRADNPEITRMRSHVGGARRRGTPLPSYETRDYILILENDPCCFCGEPMEHIDHIDALTKGGDGEWGNLTAACASCNHRKHAKSLLAFLL